VTCLLLVKFCDKSYTFGILETKRDSSVDTLFGRTVKGVWLITVTELEEGT
jgi:hypothetical protein